MPARVASYTVKGLDATFSNVIFALFNESVIVQKLEELDELGNQQFVLKAQVQVYASVRALKLLLAPLETFDSRITVSQPDMTKDPVQLMYNALKTQFNTVPV